MCACGLGVRGCVRGIPVAMAGCEDKVEIAAIKASQDLGYVAMKPEQLQIVTGVLRGRDVFGVLPTGFGKSLCFACLPYAFDQLYPANEPSIVLVLTPLTAIMKDQVANLSVRGVTAGYISGDQDDESVKDRVVKGDYQLVFFTPEMLLDRKRWRRMLLEEVYSSRLRAFVIDEAHTVKKWGETFRRVMSRIGEVRSLVPSGVTMMALTATATSRLRIQVAMTLGMTNELVVSVSPCKANIMYAVGTFTSIAENFHPIIARLRRDRTTFPRMIVYCRRYVDCADLYLLFKNQLGPEFTEPPGAPDLPRFRLVDMFMSCTEQVVKEEIVKGFTQESSLRIVFATIAFGMGIDCPKVREVIHLGPPSDLESYVQETGRAGRDGLPSLALLLLKPNYNKHTEKVVVNYTDNSTDCRRDVLFHNFDRYSHVDLGLCLCCDICAKSCCCGDCFSKHQSFVFI